MGIMDMFKAATQAPSAVPAGMQPQAAQTAVAGTPGNLPAAGPGLDSQGLPQPQQGQEGQSPFAEFEKLWETPKPVAGQVPDEPTRFAIDANKVQQAARQIDFTKTITPAILEKVKQGGEGAMEAMLSAMNEMSQVVFAQSMMAQTKVLETGLETSHQRMSKSLPETIRKQQIGTALREDNPLFTNPATAPLMGMLEKSLVSQFPSATAAEISAHARKYLTAFAGEAQKLDPNVQREIKTAAGREEDWSQVPIV